MSTNSDSDPHEDALFSLLAALTVKNQLRYQEEARTLVRSGVLETQVGQSIIRYKLTFLGCAYAISIDQGVHYQHFGWSRMGWRRKDKLAKLPLRFARCEALASQRD